MIERTEQDGIVTLTMSHGKVNAMSLEFLQVLNGQLRELEAEGNITGLVMAGNDKVFSAGVDLKRLVSEGPEYLDQFLPELSAMFLRAFRFPRPVVAAISGHAIAGGCVLACAADVRIIASEARIGVPELRVGVPFPSAGLEIMRWSATPQAFRKMITTGATFTGAVAVDAGLADAVADSDGLMESVDAAMREFEVVPPEVFQLTKRQMRQPVLDRIERSQELFGDEIDRLWRAEETRQMVTRYVKERLQGSSSST